MGHYPGLPSSKYYARAQKYMPTGQSALVTFGIKGGYEAGKKLINSVKLFSHLANLGDSKSLIIHPASTTHAQLTVAEQADTGVTPISSVSPSAPKTFATSSPTWIRPSSPPTESPPNEGVSQSLRF